MNLQEKLFESTAQWRARAASLATAALATARAQATQTAKRVDGLKGSIAVLQVTGRDLNTVARRHATRFVKQNRAIAMEAGKDVAALARSTFATLSQRGAAQRPARNKKTSARKGKKRA